MQVFLVFALLIALVAVIFAVQNTALVTVSLFIWDFNNSLAVIILLTLFAGVLISILMASPGLIKSRIARTNLRKKNKELEGKLSKVESQYQATVVEVESLKAQLAAAATPAPLPAPTVVESAPVPPTFDDEPPAAMLAGLDDPFPTEAPVASPEPVKKSKFPTIDRILNR
jgi:uncharacterized integral membrane protein